MRTLFGLLLALIVALGPAAAAKPAAKEKTPPAAQFQKPEQILKWINGYRETPEPQRLPDAVKAMGDLGLLREIDSAGVYIGFIAGVLGSNPETADKLVARMFPMPPEDQVVLVRAIAYSGLDDWKDMLGRFAERMPARLVLIRKYMYGDGKPLAALPMDEGSHVIDAHWGYFFATGSAQPVRRILEAVAWSAEKNNLERLTIGSMAKWTLASNATRDKDLLDIMKSELNTQPENVRAPLRDCIEAAETFETSRIRKQALANIEELKLKGPQDNRSVAWWGQAGQTALALGCVAAGVLGQFEVGIPCVLGGAVSSAALKFLTPQ
ncbi:MAG: hypothetical protein ACT4N2_14200 [Hyphomicrobium sp.]